MEETFEADRGEAVVVGVEPEEGVLTALVVIRNVTTLSVSADVTLVIAASLDTQPGDLIHKLTNQ